MSRTAHPRAGRSAKSPRRCAGDAQFHIQSTLTALDRIIQLTRTPDGDDPLFEPARVLQARLRQDLDLIKLLRRKAGQVQAERSRA